MHLDRDGAQLFPAALGPSEIAELRNLFSSIDQSARLAPASGLAQLVRPATEIARRYRPGAEPVFARWFDKSPERNWSLAWHQDRTIAGRQRRDVRGFTAWTVKSGLPHAVPPFDIIDRMLILRLHLDDVDEANAPLLVSPGSHRLGPIPEPEVQPAVERFGARACLAQAGDVWLYAAPLLHASDGARSPRRRRVLQLACSAGALPGGLEWLGV